VLAASYWYTYKVVKDYVEGPVKDPDRLDRADQFWVLTLGGFLLALLAAGVVFHCLALAGPG
jgi:Ni/Co efflux regulator RcnB